MADDTCRIRGCDDPKRARGLCNKHYLRAWWDDTLDLVAPLPTPEERFWAKVDVQGPDECWNWVAAVCHEGYGRFSLGMAPNRATLAHRISYELIVGSIPDGLHLDHLCRNPSCVNPMHLEPVTPGENTRRAIAFNYNRRKTHCKYGHPLDEVNTHFYVWDGKAHRACKECQRRRAREDGRKRRAAKKAGA